MATKNITKGKPRKGAKASKTTTKPQAAPRVVDDFQAPVVHPGRIGATYADNQRNYAHVRECGERIAQKLEAEETPKAVRRVLEFYLSDLGAQFFRHPAVVRAAYEAVCLVVSHPPFPQPLVTGDGDYVGRIEELLNRDPQRSLAEAGRLQKQGFLRPGD